MTSQEWPSARLPSVDSVLIGKVSPGHDHDIAQVTLSGQRHNVEHKDIQPLSLLSSLGSHLEALGCLVSECGRAPAEQQQMMHRELSAFIEKYGWKERTPHCCGVLASTATLSSDYAVADVSQSGHDGQLTNGALNAENCEPIAKPCRTENRIWDSQQHHRGNDDGGSQLRVVRPVKNSDTTNTLPSKMAWRENLAVRDFENLSPEHSRQSDCDTHVVTSSSSAIDNRLSKNSDRLHKRLGSTLTWRQSLDDVIDLPPPDSTSAAHNRQVLDDDNRQCSGELAPKSGKTSRKERALSMISLDTGGVDLRHQQKDPLPEKKQTFNHLETRSYSSSASMSYTSSMCIADYDPRVQSWTNIVDGGIGLVIIINAIVLGLSADITWEGRPFGGWDFVEFIFTAIFLAEMFSKFYRFGLLDYFVGRDKYWNIFDFTIVCIACADIAMTIYLSAKGGGNSVDMGQFTQIKMLRLGRLARLVRLLRFKFFAELKMMIQGVFAGLRVLFWAVVLFLFTIYFFAIVTANLFENSGNALIEESFGKVSWGMFTLFMCLAGDSCAASNGTPLPIHLYRLYGAQFVITYMLTVLFVTIGLFNLIMAIFVDNVMEAKRRNRQQELATNASKSETRLHRAVRETCYAEGLFNTTTRFSKKDEESISFTRDMFCSLISHESMEVLFEQLDIETCNREELFDILDADLSGELDLDEIVTGLLSLRGPAEKKDIVGTLLCTRSTQQLVRDFRCEMQSQFNLILQDHTQIRQFLQRLSTYQPQSLKQVGLLAEGCFASSSEGLHNQSVLLQI